jgi:hypothetical protein
MTDNKKERMLDLLTDEVLFGLDEKERNELRELENLFPELRNDNSLELTASAIGFSNLPIEPLPDHLEKRILMEADNFFAGEKAAKVLPSETQTSLAEVSAADEEIQKTFVFESKRPWTQWLGWAFAGLACLALAFSMWTNLQKPTVVERVVEVPVKSPSITDQYNNLLASAKDLQKATWINPKNDKETLGEVVWSEAEQKGFMKFKGLAANDAAKEDYQLWIFDETQDEKTPIDGGIFDVANNGEVLIPIDARLKFKNPKLFAVTKEKEGGVVVSDRQRLVAIAKVSV